MYDIHFYFREFASYISVSIMADGGKSHAGEFRHDLSRTPEPEQSPGCWLNVSWVSCSHAEEWQQTILCIHLIWTTDSTWWSWRTRIQWSWILTGNEIVFHLIPWLLGITNFRSPTRGWCIRLLALGMGRWHVSLIWGHVIYDNGRHFYTTLEEVDRRTVARPYGPLTWMCWCKLDVVSRGEAFDIPTYNYQHAFIFGADTCTLHSNVFPLCTHRWAKLFCSNNLTGTHSAAGNGSAGYSNYDIQTDLNDVYGGTPQLDLCGAAWSMRYTLTLTAYVILIEFNCRCNYTFPSTHGVRESEPCSPTDVSYYLGP